MATFEDVTELAGTLISPEQLYRLYNRYHWTATLSRDCDVLEVACGAGAGVGYIDRFARSIQAGDYSDAILDRARAHYGERFTFSQFDAQAMPYDDAMFDVVVMHEALYYVPDADRFVAEARRVLRPGGRILLTNSNKDLFDFNPSPHSTVYHGVIELRDLFARHGFEAEFWGSQPLRDISLIQKITRPVKKVVVRLGLMPRTMKGKQLLKRIVFGKPVVMPAEIVPDMAPVESLTPLPADEVCRSHKIVYCVARDGARAAPPGQAPGPETPRDVHRTPRNG